MDKIAQFADEILKIYPNLPLYTNISMAEHTTFRIGGRVPLMVAPTTVEQLAHCRRLSTALALRTEILGRGSNLLVADEGLDALVISTQSLHHVAVTGRGEITADAGITLARLATFAAKENLGGLVFAHGIPGSLGGAVTMNGGAYGGEMKDVVKSVRCITPQGEVVDVLAQDAHFSYRHSIFCQGDLLIAQVTLSLPHGEGEILQQEMATLAAKRRSSQPLEYPSGGSMFKRPTGYYAAALIDECGLKGFSVGGAQVSQKHAGFVVNRGGATCRDVLTLVDEVARRVKAQTGVTLEMEVKVLR